MYWQSWRLWLYWLLPSCARINEKAAAAATAAAAPDAAAGKSKIDEKMLSLGIVPVSNDSFFISALAITASFDYNKLNYNLLNEVTLCT